jgi:hypothetical protein
MMKVLRRGLAVAWVVVPTALALGSSAVAGDTTAVTGNPIKGWCEGVLRPGAGDGIAKVTVGQPTLGTASDGTAVATYTFQLTLTGATFGAGRNVHVADCAVAVAANATPTTLSGLKPKFSTQEDVPGPITSVEVSLTVPAAVRICDEAKINSSVHHIRSNVVCSGPVPQAVSTPSPPAAPPVAPPAPPPPKKNVAGVTAVRSPNTGADVPVGAGAAMVVLGLCALVTRGRLRRR